jgi:transitional endoplasmic reticulum ATPase
VVNQLLTSMDGMETLEKVTVIAATNRPDIIDPALLRPGRFDRMVLIPVPDAKSRLAILSVHTKGMPIRNVDLDAIVERTEGFVGADIENLCREAAMVALREQKDAEIVEMRHFEAALKTAKPSVDKDIMKQYESIGKALEKVRLGGQDLGMYR